MTDASALSDQSEQNSHTVREVKASTADGWVVSADAPWRRYGARSLDIMVCGGIGLTLLSIAFFLVAPLTAETLFSYLDGRGGQLIDVFLTVTVGSLLNALVMGTTGSSIGKLLFGIRVVPLEPRYGGISGFMYREFLVWLQGLGLAIPLVTLIAMVMAYSRVKNGQDTRWDDGRYQVSYRQSSTRNTILIAIGIALIVLVRVTLKYLEQI